jgi:sterol carrier protein 2
MQAPGLFNGRDARGKYGLVHNIGLGGAVVISLLRRPEFYLASGPEGRDRYIPFFRFHLVQLCLTRSGLFRLGYNHAYEVRPSSRADVDKVMSRAYSESLLHSAKL